MELVRDHTPIMDYPKYLNPKSLAAKCSKIFFHRRTSVSEKCIFDYEGESERISTLKYCPKCIREQIQEYGSGWFKLHWFFSNHCDVHCLYLVSLKQQVCSCKLNILDKVLSALSGMCVCCRSEAKFPLGNCDLYTHPEIGSRYQEFLRRRIKRNYYNDRRDIPFSVCFVRSFEQWVKEFFHIIIYDKNGRALFSKEKRALFRTKNYKALEKIKCTYGAASSDDLLHSIAIFERQSYDHFCDFLDQKIEILSIDCSDCVPARIFVDFKVAKDRDCSQCEVRSGICPLKA